MPANLWTPDRGYANTMIAADAGVSLTELVRIALYNIDQFDKIAREDEPDDVTRASLDLHTHRHKFDEGLAHIAQHRGWTGAQCNQVAALKKARPPDRLYRVRGGYHSATRGLDALGVITSYRPGKRGGAAEAGVTILGFTGGMLGSAEKPLGVPAEGLEDVTEAARTGKLDLRHG